MNYEKEDLIGDLMTLTIEEINAIALEAKRKSQFVIKNGEPIYIPWDFFCDRKGECLPEFEDDNVLKKEYRRWSKILHPDLNNGNDHHWKRLDLEYRALTGTIADKRNYKNNYPIKEW